MTLDSKDLTSAPNPAGRRASSAILGLAASRQELVLLGAYLLMILLFTFLNPLYLTTASFANILQDWAPVVLMAVGESLVIIAGGIDLSVGSTLGLSGISCALVIRTMTANGQDAWVAIAAGLLAGAAVGLAVGLVNGVLVTRARLAPFVATLATLGAASGLTLVITGGQFIAGGPAEVIQVGNTVYLSLVTAPIVVVIAVVAVASVCLHKSRFGRWTYAIGSNEFAARAAGINVERHLVRLYAISGVLAGLAGVVVYFRLGSGAPSSGTGLELNAIAAAVVGGTRLSGGVGTIPGTVLGSLIITSVLSGLILAGVEPNWQQVAIGILIAGAVIFQGFGSSARRSS